MANADLRSFFAGLATDPQRLGEFMRNPDSVLDTSGLEDEDKAAALSGDPAILRERLHDPDATAYIFFALIVIFFRDFDPRAVAAARTLSEPPAIQDFAQAFVRVYGQEFTDAFARALAETSPDASNPDDHGSH